MHGLRKDLKEDCMSQYNRFGTCIGDHPVYPRSIARAYSHQKQGEPGASSAPGHVRRMAIFSMHIKIQEGAVT